MRRWVDYQWTEASAELPERVRDADDRTRARHRLLWNTGWQFGDWLAPSVLREVDDPIEMAMPHLRSEIVAAMYHVHTTAVVSQVAGVLGDHATEAALALRAEQVRDAFVEEYVSDRGELPLPLQGHYVLALAFDLIPRKWRQAGVARLRELILAADGHLDTGFLSTPYLLDVLWDAGEHDLARTLLWQDTAPSWLYAVDRGATTIWESWEAIAEDGTPTLSSFNHYAFGSVDDWLMRRIGGVEPLAPGYARVRIAPDVDGPVTSSSAWLDTVRGRVSVSWSRDDDVVTLIIEVPAGCEAAVEVWASREAIGPGRHERRIHRPAAGQA